jgi:hypothetical protein
MDSFLFDEPLKTGKYFETDRENRIVSIHACDVSSIYIYNQYTIYIEHLTKNYNWLSL